MAYSDIDSGKVLNKEGLLELSGQIKGYINTNMPQSYTLPTASTSTLGGVKVDGETITIADGVISAVGGGSGSSATYTFANGLTESNGTVSWDLSDRIAAGSGNSSICEGDITQNQASGNYSHAEGVSTQATGYTSHAEGRESRAIGSYSHAEGYNTRANGNCSHAEGNSSIANNYYSHAEGYYTRAYSITQHVEGKFNIPEETGKFQHIVGNGPSDSQPSNMFARDWNGNEYLAGNLYVGCNDYTITSGDLTTANAGGSKVATESYVDTAIANAGGSGGSSYTAGTGISIENGVISINLANAEEGEF